MPCGQSSSFTMGNCPWWSDTTIRDINGEQVSFVRILVLCISVVAENKLFILYWYIYFADLTCSHINLHRLDDLPDTILNLDRSYPLFISSSAPSIGYCSNGSHDCLRSYENISHIMKVIDNIVGPLIDEYRYPALRFIEYDTLSFIVLGQTTDPNRLFLNYRFGTRTVPYNLHKNAFFIPLETKERLIFGQYTIEEIRYSAAIQLKTVAHEFCHLFIYKILHPNEFPYEGESGALEESFCDIFAVLTSGRINGTWNWEIGQNMGDESERALRNFRDPENSSPPQPSHYDYFDENQDTHFNCGIHNRAFYHIIKSPYFEVDFLIRLLMLTILKISQTPVASSGKIEAKFSDSRQAMGECAEILLRETGLGDADITIRVNAISQAFNNVGIQSAVKVVKK